MTQRRLPQTVVAVSILLGALLLVACGVLHRDRAIGSSQPEKLRLTLPPSLENERSGYEMNITLALKEVTHFFGESGHDLGDSAMIDTATIFESVDQARQSMAETYQVPLDNIPETFSGTVLGEALFLISQESYRDVWRKTYPQWPWTENHYHQLIVHELAHRAHEEVAMRVFGSAEAMGPAWFFEGLAITCAGQFETAEPLLSLEEIVNEVGHGRAPKVSYPLYGRLVRSLSARYGMNRLITEASRPGFPDSLLPPR